METEISVHPLLSVLGQHIQSVFDLLFDLLEAVPAAPVERPDIQPQFWQPWERPEKKG